MDKMQYYLFTIADLDFQVEKSLMNLEECSNFHPFVQECRGEHPLVFTMRRGKVAEPERPCTTGHDLEIGRYEAWITDDGIVIEFIPFGVEEVYRMRADNYWKDIVVEMPEKPGVADRLAVSGLIMAAYTYSAAFHDTLLVHASTVKCGDWGVAFLGQSGAGKSTHSQLWLKYVEGTSLLNDDQPAVRLVDGVPYLYGTPWSGKTPCYKNDRARMVAVYRMVQAPENKLMPLKPVPLFSTLLSSAAVIKEERLTFEQITQTAADLAGKIKGFVLESRPEEEAARMTFGMANKLK